MNIARPLLTIVVPTYNRASSLETLLTTLRTELAGVKGQVAVIIGDNDSPDHTAQVTRQFSAYWEDTRVVRHETNVGPEENFCRCVELVSSEYFWLIGDDDLPRPGVIKAMLALLRSTQPDLVHMRSLWGAPLKHQSDVPPVSALSAVVVDRKAFAARVHVWTTFISACIVRRSLVRNERVRQFAGSQLAQLAWVLRALKSGDRFVCVITPCIYATSGNSGGYAVLKVFGQNFQHITRTVFCTDSKSRKVGELMVRRTSLAFLPDLVWGYRQATLGAFDKTESASGALRPQLGGSLIFRFIIEPIARLPQAPAALVLRLSHGMARVVSLLDYLTARMRGGVRRL